MLPDRRAHAVLPVRDPQAARPFHEGTIIGLFQFPSGG